MTLAGLCVIVLIVMVSWRRISAGPRVVLLVGIAAVVEAGATVLQAKVPLDVQGDQELCPRCHRPRWYTLKRISACLLIIVILMVLIKYLAV